MESQSGTAKQGWLLKKAVRTLGKLSWKRRFVVVAPNPVPSGQPPAAVLRYYDGESRTSKMKHALLLQQGSVASRTSEHGKPHEFLVRAADGTHFYACADTDADADDWVATIARLLTPPPRACAPEPVTPPVPTITVAAIVPSAVPPLLPPASASGPYPSSLPPPPPTAAVAAASTVTVGEVRSLFDLVRRVESRVAKATVSGANDMGQLGTSTVTNAGVCTPETISALKQKLQPVVASCGFRHAAVITSSAALMIWGDGSGAQLGVSESMRRSIRPHLVVPLRHRRVLAVACGGSHTLAVVGDGPTGGGAALAAGPLQPGCATLGGSDPFGGELFAWGSSSVGALGLGSVTRTSWTPTPVSFPGLPRGQRVTYIAAGLVTSAAIVGGRQLFVWGDASNGRLGLGRAGSTSPEPDPLAVCLPQAAALSSSPDPVFLPQELTLRSVAGGRESVYVPTTVACGGTFTAFLGRPIASPMSSASPSVGDCGVLLVAGALGFQCRVQTCSDGSSTAESVFVELLPAPVALIELEPGEAEVSETSLPSIVTVPTATRALQERACVSALAAGPAHLLVIVQQPEAVIPPKGTLAARVAASAGAGSTAPAAKPATSTRNRGVVYAAGFSFLGHECPLFAQGCYASAQLRPVGGIVALEDAADVSAGMNFSVVRSTCGELFFWGENTFGVCRTGKYMDLFMPAGTLDPERTHCEQIAAGFNFTVALYFPGLLGGAKSRSAAKNVFGRWIARVRARLRARKTGASGVPVVGGGVKSLDDILRETAGDAGLGALSFGGDLTLSDLMAQLASAATMPPPPPA